MKDFQSVLDDYWDAAYREGEERRILDDGAAQEALSWLQAYSREAEANKARVAELEGTLAEREAWFERCIAMWKQEEVMWKEREAELLATTGMKWAGTKPD